MGTNMCIQPICVTSGLGREMNEIFIVLGRYALLNSSFMPTFWDILLVGTGSISQKLRYQTIVRRCVTAHKNADLIRPVRLLPAYIFYTKFRHNIFNGLGDDIIVGRGMHLSMYLFMVYITSFNSSEYITLKRRDSY